MCLVAPAPYDKSVATMATFRFLIASHSGLTSPSLLVYPGLFKCQINTMLIQVRVCVRKFYCSHQIYECASFQQHFNNFGASVPTRGYQTSYFISRSSGVYWATTIKQLVHLFKIRVKINMKRRRIRLKSAIWLYLFLVAQCACINQL